MKKKRPIRILSDEETREPDGNRRRPAGDRLFVKADGGFKVSALNDVGGTCEVPAGRYAVVVTRSWYDYEVGNRYVGQLTSQADVDRLAGAARTPFEPKKAGWDPSVVYFSDDAIVQ